MNLKEKIVYIISGPCGVGKSTISGMVAQKYQLSVHINADYLYAMYAGGYVKPWEDDGSRLGILRKNLKSMITNFTESNYVVVIDYVIFPQDIRDIICENIKFKYIVLMADEETIKERDLLRPADEVMGNRVCELLKEFKDKKIDNRFILDTTLLSKEEAVDVIIRENRFIL